MINFNAIKENVTNPVTMTPLDFSNNDFNEVANKYSGIFDDSFKSIEEGVYEKETDEGTITLIDQDNDGTFDTIFEICGDTAINLQDYDDDGIFDIITYRKIEENELLSVQYMTGSDDELECIYSIENLDENGTVVSENNIYDFGNDGTVDKEVIIENTESSKIFTEKYLDDEGKIESINEITYDLDYNRLSYVNSRLDENGNVIQYDYSDYENGIYYTDYSYSANGKVDERIIYDESGNITDVEIINLDKNIDNSYQKGQGDCWLLSSINALSYSEFGQEIIENAITINDDDTYSVYFAGMHKSYTISKEELEEIRENDQDYSSYSEGDNTVLLLEVAFEKALDDFVENYNEYKNKVINADKVLTAATSDEDVLYGGTFSEAMSLFANKDVKEVEDLFKFLDGFNPDERLYTISFNPNESQNSVEDDADNPCLTDINGEEIVLCGADSGHLWSVKSITDDTIVLVNPWNSAKEVIFDKEYFKESLCSREDFSCNIEFIENKRIFGRF